MLIYGTKQYYILRIKIVILVMFKLKIIIRFAIVT